LPLKKQNKGKQVFEGAEKQHKKNWLLYSLVVVSIVIHAGIFLQFSGRLVFKKPSFINISVQRAKSPKRNIPKPRLRQAARLPEPVNQTQLSSDYEFIQDVPARTVSEIFNQDEKVSDSSESEDIPQEIALDVSEFLLPEIEESGGFGSRLDYLDMVRIRIENSKQYPQIAKQRKLEGSVLVGFMIRNDGMVSDLKVIRSSGFPSLDEAAILAVRSASPFSSPPEKYFDKNVQINVPIVFEILR